MIKFNSKNHEIEYPPSPMDQFDLNLTSFKLSYASQAPSGPARLRWDYLKKPKMLFCNYKKGEYILLNIYWYSENSP